MKVSDYKALYASEAEEILRALESGVMGLEGSPDPAACIDEIFRNAHNLKGMSGAMGYDAVVEASHSLESILDRSRRGEIRFGPAEVDLLLRAVDLLRELTQAAVEERCGPAVEELLGSILVLLSPMTTREVGSDRAKPPGDEGTAACEDAAADECAAAANAPAEASPAPNKAAAPNVREKSYPKVISTRVKLESLEKLMDLVGELIISRIRLDGLARELDSKPLAEELAASGRLISEIQKEIMEARLVPVGEIFQRFKRLVRDLARELDKQAELRIVGSEIGLDRTVLESMVEPLVHLVRNALDHGIEPPADRAAAGKSQTGTVTLAAHRDRNFVVIEVSDDGRGVDMQRVAEKVSTRSHRVDAPAGISEDELCSILTTPGFSTSETVGKYSGRGVGMDIVKKKVDAFGGSMRVTSTPGRGTSVSLQLPINLSIIKALLFFIGDDVHAIPIEYVSETSRVERSSFKSIGGQTVLPTDAGVVTLVYPSELLGLPPEPVEDRYIRIITADVDGGKVGLVVNRIIGQQEVVIKVLPSMIRGVGGISGATILGSGRIAFIWDLRSLIKGRCAHEPNQEAVVLAN